MSKRNFALLVMAIVPLSVAAQSGGSSHCPRTKMDKDILVTVCTHERGMAPLGQPRMFLQVRESGVAEFEVDGPGGLVVKEIQLPDKELKFIKSIIDLPDIVTAKAEYPLYRRFTDSSMETRITLPTRSGVRTILLRNFSVDDPNNSTHYPSAIILLLKTASRLRDQSTGVTKHIPKITFCSMILDPEYSNGREIEIYANFSHKATNPASGNVVDARDVIYDLDCDTTQVTVEYEGEPDEIEAAKQTLAKRKTERFGGKARILARGRYEQKTDPGTRSLIRKFYLREVKYIEPFDQTYTGELKIGWNYVDTLNRPTDDAPVGLSVPIRHPNPGYTGLVEWTNPDMFLQVLKRGRTAVVFRVTGSTTRLAAPGRWTETFDCQILEVK